MASDDLANLRQIGQLTGQYAADNKDFFWAFSWKAGQSLSQWSELNNAPDDVQAAANQACDLARRRTGIVTLPKVTGWIPHILYSHMVLEDYAAMKLPSRMVASSADATLQLWKSDLEGFLQGKFLPNQPPPSGGGWRWPFAASYAMPPIFYSPDSGPGALYNSSQFNLWIIPGGATLGAKKHGDIAFPSQKVLFHDQFDRHHSSNRQPYFAIATGEARVPILLVDGSADSRATASANRGWQPNNPQSPLPATFVFTGSGSIKPIDPSGSDPCFGHYRFTRMATKGRDFGGPEIPYP